MPTMGRPLSNEQNRFANVKMAEKKNELNSNEKQRLVNKLTGYKPKRGEFVDAKKHNKMGKDEFLKLLTHQLTNQDPVKPMDQKDMAGQLAQFSQLEQLANLNSKFDKFGGNKAVEDKFYGASFLGKEVVTTGSSLNLKEDGGEADVLFDLPKPASKVMVRIFDKQNAMVGEVWKENIGRGSQNITWDGISLDGTTSAKGDYRVQVTAWDQNSDPIEVETKTRGIVQSVNFDNGEAILTVDGKRIYLRDVDSFSMPDTKRMQQAMNAAQAETAQKNLPLAQNVNSKVNLNSNKASGLNSYKKNEVNTGITNVYDVE